MLTLEHYKSKVLLGLIKSNDDDDDEGDYGDDDDYNTETISLTELPDYMIKLGDRIQSFKDGNKIVKSITYSYEQQFPFTPDQMDKTYWGVSDRPCCSCGAIFKGAHREEMCAQCHKLFTRREGAR